VFFFLSKILWPLTQPLYLAGIFMVGGFLLLLLATGKREKRGMLTASKISLGLGVCVFFVFGAMPTGHNLLVILERQYPRTEITESTAPDGIIVLGGMFNGPLSRVHGQSIGTGAMERVVTFHNLARRYQHAPDQAHILRQLSPFNPRPKHRMDGKRRRRAVFRRSRLPAWTAHIRV